MVCMIFMHFDDDHMNSWEAWETDPIFSTIFDLNELLSSIVFETNFLLLLTVLLQAL